MFHFIFSWKYREPCVQFSQYASEAPHIYCVCVRYPKYYFRCSIESRLYICIYPLILEAARPKINYFNPRLVRTLQQYVLWLQVTVYHILLLQVLQCLEYLYCKPPYQTQRNSLEIVVLYELIQINRKQFKRYNQMLPENQIVFNSNYVVCVLWVLLFQML